MQEKILSFFMKQGFPIFILLIAIWWFDGKYTEQHEELKECNDGQIEILKTVLKDNTASNYKLIEYLKDIHNHKE